MSGINRTTPNDLPQSRGLFDDLIAKKSSGLVLRDGEVVHDGSMSWRSGVHRMFGQEKSQDDVNANRETMKFLLSHISENVSDQEMLKIMDSKVRLGGEKEGYTVRERLDRGTYVSSELVKQLRTITGIVRQESLDNQSVGRGDIGAELPIHLMTTREINALARRNLTQVDHAFGIAYSVNAPRHRPEHFRSGALSELALTPFGEQKAPTLFQKCINELCEKGTGKNPIGQTEVWNEFRDFWTSNDLPRDQVRERTKLINEFHREVDDLRAQCQPLGLEISQDDIKDLLLKLLGSPEQMEKFENRVQTRIEGQESQIALETAQRISEGNNRLVETMDPDGLVGVVEQWLTDNPEFEGAGQKLLENLGRAGNFARELNLTPQELKSVGEIEGRLRGEQTGGSPFEVTENLRQALKARHEANPAREEMTNQHVARLLDGTLREMLAPSGQPPVNQEVETRVQTDLEDLFDSVDGMIGRSSGNTVGEKTRSLLSQQVEELSLKHAIQTARNEGKNLSSPDVQREIAQNTRQMIEKHREMQESFLPVLDEYVAFQRETEALNTGEGGLKGLNQEKLQELDGRSDQIRAQREQIDSYIAMLKQDFGDDVEGLAGELDDMNLSLALVGQYDVGSGREDREYVARIGTQLGELPPTDSLVPFEKPVWMRDRLHEVIAPYPSLQRFCETLDPNVMTRIRDSEDIEQLLVGTLHRGMQMELQQSILNDTSIPQTERSGRAREAMLERDNIWDEEVKPALNGIQLYGTLPPLPEQLDVDSISRYRAVLTGFIDEGEKVVNSLGELNQSFVDHMRQGNENLGTIGNIGGPGTTGTMGLGTIAEIALTSMSVIGMNIEVAKQRLRALSDQPTPPQVEPEVEPRPPGNIEQVAPGLGGVGSPQGGVDEPSTDDVAKEREYLDGVEDRLGKLTVSQTAPRERKDGISDSLHRQIAPFPALGDYVESLTGTLEGIQNVRNLSQLFGRTVYEPAKQKLEQHVNETANPILNLFGGKTREEVRLFDEYWNSQITSNLNQLRRFGEIPPPPQTLSRESIQEYRETLDSYIKVAGDVSQALINLGVSLGEFGNDQARQAMERSQQFVDVRIKEAEALRKALDETG